MIQLFQTSNFDSDRDSTFNLLKLQTLAGLRLTQPGAALDSTRGRLKLQTKKAKYRKNKEQQRKTKTNKEKQCKTKKNKGKQRQIKTNKEKQKQTKKNKAKLQKKKQN